MLVVDDEVDMPTLYQQRFRKEIKSGKWQLDFAYSGSEALDLCKKLGEEVALILSDINMPGMTGLEMLKQLRREIPGQKPVVIMVTAYGDEKNYNMAMEYGANGFITKPVDFEELKKQMDGYTTTQ